MPAARGRSAPAATAPAGATVTIDGVAVPAEAAVVSVFDRGFLYGDAVFETIRTYGGRPFELEQHLARLAESARRVYIPLPLSVAALGREVSEAVSRAGHPEAYVRVMVTRGAGEFGLSPGEAGAPLRVIIVLPLVLPPPSAYAQGIDVVSFATRRAADATDAQGAKVANYLVAVLAMRRARAAGALEALVVDGAGNVVEGATSNVFVLSRGELSTPPEEAGILVGITRARVLEAARALEIPAKLRNISLGELVASDEVFISSSVREILPVVRVDGRVIGAGVPGPVTRRLHQRFREKVWEDMNLGGSPPRLDEPRDRGSA